MSRPAVVIVGGGVIGLATAYELLRRGRDVTVLEREAEVGRGASGVAAGILAPFRGEVAASPDLGLVAQDSAAAALEHFALDSLRMYPQWVRELEGYGQLSCCYRDDGALFVTFTQEQTAHLDLQRTRWQSRGIASTSLGAAEVLGREPRLAARIHAGAWVGTQHQVEPRALLINLQRAVVALGGTVRCGVTVREVLSNGTGVRGLLTDIGSVVTADAVVLAAGAWTGTVVSPCQDLGVRPVKGQLLRLRGPALVKQVVRTPTVYLVPVRDGELWVGATVEERGFSTAPTADAVLALLHDGAQALPGLQELEFVACAVGVRPAVSDLLPVIGPVRSAGYEGLWLATAHYRNGLLLAPATARALADAMETGVMSAATTPFAAERFWTSESGDSPEMRLQSDHAGFEC